MAEQTKEVMTPASSSHCGIHSLSPPFAPISTITNSPKSQLAHLTHIHRALRMFAAQDETRLFLYFPFAQGILPLCVRSSEMEV